MNKTLIAAAVSAALLAPVAAQADEEVLSEPVVRLIEAGISEDQAKAMVLQADEEGVRIEPMVRLIEGGVPEGQAKAIVLEDQYSLDGHRAKHTKVTVYGRIHQGIQIVDTDNADSDTDFITVGSRFGIKAHSDLGNGLSAHGRYEFRTETDEESSGDEAGVTGLRLAYVGVSGGFGTLRLGQQWGAYYNTAGIYFDPFFWVGASYGDIGVPGGSYRIGNTVKYSNTFGPVYLEVDKRIGDDADEDEQDGYTVGVSIAAHDNITVAAALDDEDDASSTALAVQLSSGNYWASLGWHGIDNEGDADDPSVVQFLVGGSFGKTDVWLGVSDTDMGGSNDVDGNEPSDFTVAVYHDVGGGLGLLYEGRAKDTDGGTDSTTHLLGMRLDF